MHTVHTYFKIGIRSLMFCFMAVCMAVLMSGCTTSFLVDTGIRLSYHTGKPSELVAMEAVEQFDSDMTDTAYLCNTIDRGSLGEKNTLFLQVEKNEPCKVVVTYQEKEISLQDGFYPIVVEENAPITVTSRYDLFGIWKQSSTYTISCTNREIASLSNIFYRIDEDISMPILEFQKDITTYSIPVPYTAQKVTLIPKASGESELRWNPSEYETYIPIVAKEEEEVRIPVELTVVDPTGEKETTIYTVMLVVEPMPKGTDTPQKTPTPKPTKLPTATPSPTPTPSPELGYTIAPIPTVTPTPTPTVTPTPTPTKNPDRVLRGSILVPNIKGMYVGKTPSEAIQVIFEAFPEFKQLSVTPVIGPNTSGIVTGTRPAPGSVLNPGSYLEIYID